MGGKPVGPLQLSVLFARAGGGTFLLKGISGNAFSGIADDFIPLLKLLFPGSLLPMISLLKPDILLSGGLINHPLSGKRVWSGRPAAGLFSVGKKSMYGLRGESPSGSLAVKAGADTVQRGVLPGFFQERYQLFQILIHYQTNLLSQQAIQTFQLRY